MTSTIDRTHQNQRFAEELVERVDRLKQLSGRHALELTDSDIASGLQRELDPYGKKDWNGIWSRIRRGERGISSLELTVLAQLLETSTHWLITGEPDPHRVRIRHCDDYDRKRDR